MNAPTQKNSCFANQMPWLLSASTALLAGLMLWAIFCYAPLEASQGWVQKIFYIHLGFVAPMYLASFVGMLASVIYLATRKPEADALAVASLEVCFLFTTCVLLSGSIWAKPVWGTWWTWEPRLTSTFLIWLLYASYHFIRHSIGRQDSAYVWSAVFAIVAFLDVPLIHYSIRLFRGVHPKVITGGGITGSMWLAVGIAVVSAVCLATYITWIRFQIEMMQRQLDLQDARSREEQ